MPTFHTKFEWNREQCLLYMNFHMNRVLDVEFQLDTFIDIFLDTFNSGHLNCIPGYIDSSKKNSLNFHLIVFRDKVNFVLSTQQNCVHHRKIRFPNEVSTMNM